MCARWIRGGMEGDLEAFIIKHGDGGLYYSFPRAKWNRWRNEGQDQGRESEKRGDEVNSH